MPDHTLTIVYFIMFLWLLCEPVGSAEGFSSLSDQSLNCAADLYSIADFSKLLKNTQLKQQILLTGKPECQTGIDTHNSQKAPALSGRRLKYSLNCHAVHPKQTLN